MPAYRIDYPGAEKPRMIEGRHPRDVRAFAAKSFTVTALGPREIYDLTEQGIDLERVENGGGS